MACSPENHERLVDLACGRLEGAEADAVLAHVAECAECSDGLEWIADLMTVTEALPAAAGPAPGAEVARRPRRDAVSRRWYFRVAAAVLIAGVVGTWSYMRRPPTADLSALVDITPLPFIEARQRGAVAERQALFDAAMVEYNRGDYRAAADRLSELAAADPDDHRARNYLGICLLQMGKPAEAVDVLSIPGVEGRGLAGEISLWYLTMAYLMQNDAAAAFRTLERLTAMGGEYLPNAEELESRIKEIE